MSASQEKRVRKQLREEGKDKRQIAQKKAEKAAKRRHVKELVAGIVVVLVVAAIIFISSNMLYTSIPALKVGSTNYSAAEYSFFYNYSYIGFKNQYSSYLSMFGLDTNKPLDEQNYTDGQTWADYFKEQAQTTMKETTALYDDSVKTGFKLSDEDKSTLENNIASLSAGYEQAGFPTADAYLVSLFGKGCNEKLVNALYEKFLIAQFYSKAQNDSYKYTDDQLKTYYTENKNDLDNYTYISYFADGSVKDDASANPADASASPAASPEASPSASPDTEAAKTAAMDKAKGIADTIAAAGKTEEDFKSAVLAASQSEATPSTTQGSSLSETYADWLKDASRKAGDTTVVKADNGYYALYYISRDDNSYKTVDVRHILVKAVAGSDGKYTDEAKATAKQKAEDLLAQWKAGAATEDSFAELATANSEDTGSSANGGLYENVAKGQMVAGFNDWCFAADRKTGDSGIVYGESGSYAGYHVMYYVGQGRLYRDILAENGQRNKDFTAWKDGLLKNYEVKTALGAGLVKEA